MPLDRPRRIFRGASRARPLPPSVGRLLLAGGLGAAGCVGLLLFGVPTTLSGSAPMVDRLQAAAGTVAVVDGSTLRLQGQVVQLRGVEAPSRDAGGTCGQADCAGEAALRLAALVRDRTVDCRLDERTPQGRPQAWCTADGIDVNGALGAVPLRR